MANNISANISKDCEVITVKIVSVSSSDPITVSASRNGTPIALNPNNFPAPPEGQVFALSFSADQLTTITSNTSSGTAAELSGVYVFTASQGSEVAQSGVLAACTLDCCIANEINDYMACPCDPTESPKLDKATKVFLLREGAEADLSASILNPDNAIAKFNKATELCASSCGCGC